MIRVLIRQAIAVAETIPASWGAARYWRKYWSRRHGHGNRGLGPGVICRVTELQ